MISNKEKILHWLIFLSFLGLVTTALAAEFFFSKEAIMGNLQKSLPLLNIDIAPADQFFIARIARRDTWDIHFYFGVLFSSLIFIWMVISIYKKKIGQKYIRLLFFSIGLVLSISGVVMFLRLYYPLEESVFSLLKSIHKYAYYGFFVIFLFHIVSVLHKENSSQNGVVSKMLKRIKKSGKETTLTLAALVLMAFGSQTIYAQEESDFAKWSADSNYINGVMYLEGEKGAQTLKLELANCPYEKCINATTKKEVTGFKIIEIKKPDYKKAIELLKISSSEGNPMASDRLLSFLLKRTNYKALKPDKYLVDLLKKDTGLEHKDYKKIIHETLAAGIKTKKACYSSFVGGEFYEGGYMGFTKDMKLAKKYYLDASLICKEGTFYKMIATTKAK